LNKNCQTALSGLGASLDAYLVGPVGEGAPGREAEPLGFALNNDPTLSKKVGDFGVSAGGSGAGAEYW
jgi:hypothetical protein